ncbi:WD40 repeat domain-containing protein [Streptomyces sp. S.PNR 29]|uniref:caspase, EACC1-associated type n=1 Tax=Streptomyces sp. S.PNR 29 TaxID=2973805 RepID=UPI0025AFF58C|nr:WD40 repeat domain-containing protein [Streptomyces sp. S.PNR 29]MDN0200573.1 NACHT and WD repeat domain-containing protein [Streptomyces sp. S.PNR 29]
MTAPGQVHPDSAGSGLSLTGARAVLVGTGRHRDGSRLADLPGVDTTLDDLAQLLRELCGMPPEHVLRVPSDSGPDVVVEAVTQACEEADGVVLFCHVGHGLLGPGNKLYLATHGSMDAQRVAGAVPYETVKGLLEEAPFGSVVILDCCFSGMSQVPHGSGATGPYVQVRPSGSFLLASASSYAPSFAPEGQRHTLFGGKLISLLRDGDPAGPPMLTLDRLHRGIEERSDDTTRPHASSEGTLGGLVIAPNRAYRFSGPPAAEPPAPLPCPYFGMRPLGPNESTWFFGRDRELDRLAEAVEAPEAERRPVIVIGASGAGKSSLLGAGLLARLDRYHAMGRTRTWPVLRMLSPGKTPLQSLANQWAEATGLPPGTVLAELAAGRFPAPPADARDDHEQARRPAVAVPRVLVIDQFEEVFTTAAKTERTDFLRLVSGSADGDRSGPDDARPRIVLAVRADFYGECLADPGLRAALSSTPPVHCAPLDGTALREAIEGPAERGGLELEPGLVDRILWDLRRSDGDTPVEERPAAALPLLAHALQRTWVNRSGARMTLAGYQATGGIWKSVTESCKTLHDSLTPAERRSLRTLLLSLVHLTPTGEPVARRVTFEDVLAGHGPDERERLRAVCESLRQKSLITLDQDGLRIAHEALLYAWTDLRTWILGARARLLARQQLTEAAHAWNAGHRHRDYLYTGNRLSAVRAWAAPGNGPDTATRPPARRTLPESPSDPPGSGTAGTDDEAAGGDAPPVLTGLEREFLHSSLRADRRRKLTRALLTGGVLALALLLTVVGTLAYTERAKSREQAAVLASQRIAAQADVLRAQDPAAALDLSLTAYRTSPTEEAKASMVRSALTPVHTRLGGHSKQVFTVAYRPDGAVLASSSRDGTVRLWHTRDPYRPRPGPVIRVGGNSSVFWAPDGRHLYVQTVKDLQVYDVRQVDRPRRTARATTEGLDRPYRPALSADGTTLALPLARGRMVLWDLRNPASPVPHAVRMSDDSHDLIAVAWRPDGKLLAVTAAATRPGGRDRVQLWDTADPTEPRLRTTLRRSATAMVFSADGRSLTTALPDRGITTLDVSDPDQVKTPEGISGYGNPAEGLYWQVARSPDGRHLAAAGSTDGNAWIYQNNATTTTRDSFYKGEMLPGSVPLVSVAYRPDGRGVVTGDEKGGVHLWSPPPHSVDGAYTSGGRFNPSDAFAPGHRLFATDDDDLKTSTIWRLTGTMPRKVDTLPTPWRYVAFLPGGALFLARDPDGRRTGLWDLSGGRPELRHVFTATHGPTAVSPNGDRLALQTGEDGPLVIWDVSRPDRPRRTGSVPVDTDGTFTPVFTAPDVLAVMSDEVTQLWNLAVPGSPRRGQKVPGSASAAVPQEGKQQALLLVKPAKGPKADERLAVYRLSPAATAHKLRDDVTVDRQRTTVAFTVLDHRFVVTLPAKIGQPRVWDLDEPAPRGSMDPPAGLPGSHFLMEGITAGDTPRGGVVAAWQEETGARDLAVWTFTADASADGPHTGRFELIYDVPAVTEGISGFSVLQPSPNGDALVLSTGPGLTAGLGGQLVLLPTDPDRLAGLLCEVRPGTVPRGVWTKAFPDLEYHDPCG